MAHHVGAEEAAVVGGGDGALQGAERPGVLTPQVDVAPLAARGPAGDGHGLEHGEGVALQEDPVFEGPRLGLVGVAHQVVGPDGLGRHCRPLPPGRKAAPPRPTSLESVTSRITPAGPRVRAWRSAP